MNEEELIRQEIAYLVDQGALVPYGMDGDDFMYHMVPDVMKEVHPEFYKAAMDEIDETILDLYEQGLVNIEYDENLSALISLTDEGIAMAEQIMRDYGQS